jgi:hypothetical protein
MVKVNIISHKSVYLIFSVTSAREWLTFACESWIKTDAITKVTEDSPILFFTVRQITIGAKVENEPILQTRKIKLIFCYYVKNVVTLKTVLLLAIKVYR